MQEAKSTKSLQLMDINRVQYTFSTVILMIFAFFSVATGRGQNICATSCTWDSSEDLSYPGTDCLGAGDVMQFTFICVILCKCIMLLNSMYKY